VRRFPINQKSETTTGARHKNFNDFSELITALISALYDSNHFPSLPRYSQFSTAEACNFAVAANASERTRRGWKILAMFKCQAINFHSFSICSFSQLSAPRLTTSDEEVLQNAKKFDNFINSENLISFNRLAIFSMRIESL